MNERTIRKTAFLSSDAAAIRREVFMEEQGFREEFDEIDKTAVHLVMYEKGEPIAVCRYYPDPEPNCWRFGRLAIRKPYRVGGRGRALLAAAEADILQAGGQKVRLSAQVRVQGFYEKCGYRAVGDIYLDEDCPHIQMEKALETAD